jgi:hypothetical protein
VIVQVLVATDVLARGIDVDNCMLVINYDMPKKRLDRADDAARNLVDEPVGPHAALVCPPSHLPYYDKLATWKGYAPPSHLLYISSGRCEHGRRGQCMLVIDQLRHAQEPPRPGR